MMSADDKARLFYLLIILFFISGSLFFNFSKRLSNNLRNIAIWSVIFIGLIIGYGFRETLSGQLLPSQVIQNGDTLVLNKANDGHFYARLLVNGSPLNFLVDTGASGIVLNQAAAHKIGIDVNRLNFSVQSQTANGIIASARIKLRSVQIGTLVDHQVSAFVNGGALPIPLLGMEYLSRFGEIRIVGERLILTR